MFFVKGLNVLLSWTLEEKQFKTARCWDSQENDLERISKENWFKCKTGDSEITKSWKMQLSYGINYF